MVHIYRPVVFHTEPMASIYRPVVFHTEPLVSICRPVASCTGLTAYIYIYIKTLNETVKGNFKNIYKQLV